MSRKNKIITLSTFLVVLLLCMSISALAIEQTSVEMEAPLLRLTQYNPQGYFIVKQYVSNGTPYYTDFGGDYGLAKIYQFQNVYAFQSNGYNSYGTDTFTVDLKPKREIYDTDKITYAVLRFACNLQYYNPNTNNYFNYPLRDYTARLNYGENENAVNRVYGTTIFQGSSQGPYIFEFVISNPDGISFNYCNFAVDVSGKPNASTPYYFQFGLCENSLIEFSKGSDKTNTIAGEIGHEIDDINGQLESPVDKPTIPTVSQPTFNFDSYLNWGSKLITFSTSLIIVSISFGLFSYLLYGKRG